MPEFTETESAARSAEASGKRAAAVAPCPEPRSQEANSLFNLDHAIARLGSRELFQEMVRFFFGEGLQLVEEIKAAADRGDAAVVQKRAHRLKGTVLYLGAEPAVQAIARVEMLVRSGELAELAPATAAMEAEVTRLAEALRPYA